MLPCESTSQTDMSALFAQIAAVFYLPYRTTFGHVQCKLSSAAFLRVGVAVFVLHSEKRSVGLRASGTGQRC